MRHKTTVESQDSFPSTAAFVQANDRMHEDMVIDLTGDPDVDFITAMIPRHQAAIDMARVVIEYGTDPEVRALAQEVITAPEAEIEMMRQWLAEHRHCSAGKIIKWPKNTPGSTAWTPPSTPARGV